MSSGFYLNHLCPAHNYLLWWNIGQDSFRCKWQKPSSHQREQKKDHLNWTRLRLRGFHNIISIFLTHPCHTLPPLCACSASLRVGPILSFMCPAVVAQLWLTWLQTIPGLQHLCLIPEIKRKFLSPLCSLLSPSPPPLPQVWIQPPRESSASIVLEMSSCPSNRWLTAKDALVSGMLLKVPVPEPYTQGFWFNCDAWTSGFLTASCK